MGGRTADNGKRGLEYKPAFLVGPRPIYALGLIARKWGQFYIVGEARELTRELARELNPMKVAILIVNDPSLLFRQNSKEVIEILEKGIRLLVVEADKKPHPKGYLTIVYEIGFISLGSGLKKAVGVVDIAYSVYEKVRSEGA